MDADLLDTQSSAVRRRAFRGYRLSKAITRPLYLKALAGA
jgi:hypothetical protein